VPAFLTHLLQQHDFKLVVLAAIVCECGAVTAFRLYARLRGSKGIVRAAWTLLTGIVAGAGVWATHFLLIMAYDPGLRIGYWPGSTLASLIIAIMAMCGGFMLATSPKRSNSTEIAGGVLIGFGLGAMHYVGLTGMAVQGHMVWNPAIAGLSVAFAVIGSIVALYAVGSGARVYQQLLGALLITIAVVGLHFSGMAALTIRPDYNIPAPPELLSPVMISFGVSAIAAVMILGGLGAALIEASTTNSALDRMRRLANAAFEGIVVLRDGVITDCNQAFAELAGSTVESMRGQMMDDLLVLDGDEDLVEDERREGYLKPVDGGREAPVEIFARLMDDGARRDTSGLVVLALRDLRERQAAEEKIRYLAEHDGLTDLPNRHALQSRLAGALERVEASRETLALLCVDIDHFKELNDLHGHQAGDDLLVEVSKRLQAQLSGPSFAARLGADEFIVVQVAGGDQPPAAAELATQILEAMAAPFENGREEIQLGCSIGVSLYPDDGRTAEALMANADMALFRAKEGGRGGYRFFKREMDDAIREQRTMARDLRHAISNEELVLYYQPIARTTDGRIAGFEALVRWQHPSRGLVPPIEFIPLAEESGLIIPLGEWALRRACADAASWERPLRVAVNLSPLQLHQPNLTALVESVLEETGLVPHRLELEITEGALFHDQKRALAILRQLKALGVRIAMDDFGTGFSSLSSLQSFPFDKLKIDKSFVEKIEKDDRAMVIVKAVLGLGRSLEIPVVAEGVETESQLHFLRGEACAEVQGYHIGRPMPIRDIEGWTTAAGAAPIALNATRKQRTA
jgi:diguanylate cyclase (GGDEF)-like protein/PAS domain S-box-containing protein